MKSLGRMITEARKRKGIRGEDLGSLIGQTKSNVSKIENDEMKTGIDPRTLIRVSDALDAPEILEYHCESCPIRQHIMMQQFPELNNIEYHPSIIANRLRQELQEAAQAADDLSQIYGNKEYRAQEADHERILALHEQIVDAERAIEILKFELLRSGGMTSEERREIVRRQQAKCEARGYHKIEGERGAK